jgi:rRNA maturation RNase YbeY
MSAARPLASPKAWGARHESTALNDRGEIAGVESPQGGDRGDVASLQVDVKLSEGIQIAALQSWLERVVRDLAPDSCSLAVRLTGTAEVQALNERYRHLDKPTDVLSFPGEESPEGRHLGDIIIAVPIAQRQALEAGHDLLRELRVLALHGILHCLGYDHETDDGQMDRVESDLRQRWVDLDA